MATAQIGGPWQAQERGWGPLLPSPGHSVRVSCLSLQPCREFLTEDRREAMNQDVVGSEA